MMFELGHAKKLVVNNKDNRVLLSRKYRADSCPLEFDVLKTSIFALDVSFLGQIIVFRTSIFCTATISR